MRRLTAFLALILTLAFASAASAKEIVALKVCGASDCRATTDPQLIQAVESSNESVPPGAKAPWYRVEARMRIEGAADEHFTLAFAPRLRMLRGGEPGSWYWMLLSKEDAAAFGELTRDLGALPASRLRGTGPPIAERKEPRADAGEDGGLPVSLAGLALAVPLGGAALVLLRRRGGSSGAASP
jgi:hypothetical protein